MKSSKTLDLVLVVSAAVLPFGAVLWGCGGGSSSRKGGTTGFVQVERLGRPAVNEGLVVSNAFLNAYNSIPPDQDLAVLTANAPFLAEVNANLDAVDALVAPAGDVVNGDIIQAFIPDVMRVDTSRTIAVGTSAYADGALLVGTSAPRPISGRKITDDVVDITLTVLGSPLGAQGAVSDNVDYRDATLNDGVGQPDHDLLFGQAAVGTGADFPYLAAPN